jgi:hypothetical protein
MADKNPVSAPVARFVQPTSAEMAAAAAIVDSPAVISAFAACAFDELSDDGKVWIAAIVREAVTRERQRAAPYPRQHEVMDAMARARELYASYIEEDDDAPTQIGAEIRDGLRDSCHGVRIAFRAFRLAAAEPRDGGGWIVGNGAGTLWRTWRDGFSDWTADRVLATRYARREDAEAVHYHDEDAWTVQRFEATA